MHSHAAVFIDHQEARVYAVDAANTDKLTIRVHHRVHRHPQPESGKHDAAAETHFFAEVAAALKDVEGFLVVGPTTAKTEFVHYLDHHDRALRAKVVGIETVDHPTDPELVALARKRFFPGAVLRVHGAS